MMGNLSGGAPEGVPLLFLTDEYLKRALSVVEGLNIHFLNDDSSFDLIEEAKKRKQLFY